MGVGGSALNGVMGRGEYRRGGGGANKGGREKWGGEVRMEVARGVRDRGVVGWESGGVKRDRRPERSAEV